MLDKRNLPFLCLETALGNLWVLNFIWIRSQESFFNPHSLGLTSQVISFNHKLILRGQVFFMTMVGLQLFTHNLSPQSH